MESINEQFQRTLTPIHSLLLNNDRFTEFADSIENEIKSLNNAIGDVQLLIVNSNTRFNNTNNDNNINIDTDAKKIRLFNVLPLRTNIIGKNITIDTCALIYNFCGKTETTK